MYHVLPADLPAKTGVSDISLLMPAQSSTAEKLRREVVRLTSEAERFEKEVQRQKNLR